MKHTKKLFALILCVAMIFSSLTLIASADDVPALNDREGIVVLHEGLKFTGVYGTNKINDSWMPGYNSSYCEMPGGEALNLNSYDYIEFDYYVDSLANFTARVSDIAVEAYRTGKGVVSMSYKSKITQSGWNHIRIDIPRDADTEIFKKCNQIRFVITQSASNTGSSNAYKIANITVTVDEVYFVPEFGSTDGKLVLSKNLTFFGTYGTAAVDGDFLSGMTNIPTPNRGEETDFTQYDYIEFDYYVKNLEDLKSRVDRIYFSIVYYSGSNAQVTDFLDMLTTDGWNHIKFPINKGSLLQRVIAVRIRVTMPESDIAANDIYAVANICASTADSGYVPSLTESVGMFAIKSGLFKNGKLGSSAVSSTLPGYDLNGSIKSFPEITDLTAYDKIEFDYYIEDIDNFKARVSSFEITIWNSSSQGTSYGDLSQFATAGWNHISYPLSSFNQSRLTTAAKVGFRPVLSAGSTGEDDSYAVANIRATKNQWLIAPEIQSLEETIIINEGAFKTGTLGSSAVSSTLPGYDLNGSIKSFSEITDLTAYDKIEFDYYIENIDNFKARVSSFEITIWNSSGQGTSYGDLSQFATAGWNHISYPLSSFNQSRLTTAAKVGFRPVLSAGSTGTEDHYTVANICVTKQTTPAVIEEPTVNIEPLILSTGNTFSGTYGSSTVSNNLLPGSNSRIKLDEETDFSIYKYIVFDYYVANLTNLKARVTELNLEIVHYSDGAQQVTNFLDLLTKDGWNHVKVPIITGTDRDWVIKRATRIKFKITMPASETAATDNYIISDVRAIYKNNSLETYDFNQSVTLGRNETERIITWISDTSLGESKLILTKNKVETTFAVSERYSDYLGYYSYSGTIAGLTANTNYTYRIETEDYKSVEYSFGTKDFDNTFSFLQISDIQLDGTSGVNGRWLETLDRINTNFPNTSLIVNSGDVSDRSSKNAYYQAYKAPEILKSYVSSVVPGNHDSGTVGYDTYYSINFSAPDTYVSYDNYQINQYDYWHSYNNVLFICLNSLIDDVEYHKNFVKNVVEERGDNYDWIIVNCHYSLFSASYHSTELATIKQRSVLAKLFNDLGVDMVLSGHDHIYDRTYLMNKQNPIASDKNYGSTSDGVLYISCTTGSGLKYNTQEDTSIPYSAVTSAETYGFINYEVSEGAITMTFYSSADMSVIDTFTLFKDNDDIEFPDDTMDDKTDILGGAKNITFASNGNYTFDLSGAPKNVSADRMFETDVYVTGDSLTNITVKLTDSSGKLATYQFTGLSAGWNHLAARIDDFSTASGFNKAQVTGMTLSSVAGGNIVATNCYTADYVDGDANRDGMVDVKDIVRAKKMATDPSTAGNKLAVASNGVQITAVDLTALVQSVINSLFS